ncbi:MAG: amidohydrolase family protein, partial [Fimbriimonas ginsengisoli]|nr:amidohydrolase family protein [Fimbriimonas ginsengisoli]
IGLDVTADVYPYVSWTSRITALVPSRDWENRAIWEKGLADVGGPQNVLLATYTPDPNWAVKTIAAIADRTGKDPIAIIQEVVRRTVGPGAGGSHRVVVTAMVERDLRRFIAAPRIMFSSDGAPGLPHPRGAGSYPRVLGRYVREQHVLTLEAAIRKMTSLPAWRTRLRDRGALRPGMKADLVIFNPHTVLDTATPTNPTARPVGITDVIVNGVPVLADGRMTAERPGRALNEPS